MGQKRKRKRRKPKRLYHGLSKKARKKALAQRLATRICGVMTFHGESVDDSKLDETALGLSKVATLEHLEERVKLMGDPVMVAVWCMRGLSRSRLPWQAVTATIDEDWRVNVEIVTDLVPGFYPILPDGERRADEVFRFMKALSGAMPDAGVEPMD